MWLLVVAAFGLLVPNGFFIHWLMTGDKSLDAVLGNELALGFILDCTLAMVLLAWLFALRPPGRVRWPWFVVLSLAGGLAFSIPLYLWLNRRLSSDAKESFGAWWRSTGLLLIAVSTAALATAPAQAAELRRFTLDDEMALRTINDVEISPDGALVAYTVSTPSLEKNEHQVALYVVPADGGEPRRLGESVRILNTPLPAPRLRWSPDGAAVGLLAVAGEKPQAFAVPLDSSVARQLTDAPEGISGFAWSPDGKSVAYLTREPLPPEEAKRRALVIHAGAPDPPSRLVVRPLGGGEPRTLTSATQYVDSFSWTPDGRELVYSAAPRSGFTAQYETRIYAVAAGGGEPRTIVDRPGLNNRVDVSPDGRWVAFITSNRRFDIMAARSLAVVPITGGEPRILPLGDAWVNEWAWASDSRSIYLQANDGTFGQGRQMFEQPIVRVPIDGGPPEQLTTGVTVNYALTLSRDGKRLAYRAVEGRAMGDVVVMDTATRKVTKLTEVNPQLRELALGKLEPVSWRSFDGMEIWGLLLTPHGGWAGERLPMLVYIHGGPGGGVTHGLFPQFMHTVGQVDPFPTEAMAGAGYAVLFPMPRGGAGYGEAGQRTIVNRWGEDDYRDIMAGVDAMIDRGIADADRLGVMGASYGGYMTNWIVTQTGRFKAAAAAASICDLEDARLLVDGGEIMTQYFREPWENRESYAAHSPLNFVEKVTTPLLLQHGERDPRVPVGGAWKMYRALKALGKTVELYVYPRGAHVMYEPMLQREVMEINLEWFLPSMSAFWDDLVRDGWRGARALFLEGSPPKKMMIVVRGEL
ncbi:MAG TPA: S9 family peptidase [Thermoanaerobaculia bacterium]|nr:S9 family peptidase [Thermoanaerobaculia bacterium]